MNNFIKQVIEEKFASKKQSALFFAKANDKSLSPKERLKWKKWAKEFSEKTNYKKIPKKVKKDVDEIVDEDGNMTRGSKDGDANTKGITSKSTSDQVVRSAMGMVGGFGTRGLTSSPAILKYWNEADMSKTLGYEDTLGQDASLEDAVDHFEGELELDPNDTEERLEKMGYDSNLPDGKVRLVENPKKFIEEYIESLLSKKTKSNDLVRKGEIEEKEINPVLTRQLSSLKQTLKDNDLSVDDVLKYLRDNE